jgi:DNA-binding MarR family transcriptional regulator
MSDVEIVLSALPRILLACRVRAVSGGATTVSAHQGQILSQLDRDDPTMVTELAASMAVTASTMSLNLKRLREAGLVVCERDPDDRRVMNVRLTEAGERAKTALRPLDAEKVEAMLESLWPEDRRRALEGLAVLADAADGLAATKPGRVSSISTASTAISRT